MLMLEGVRMGIDLKGVDLPETPHVNGTPAARSNRTLRASHAPRAIGRCHCPAAARRLSLSLFPNLPQSQQVKSASCGTCQPYCNDL